MTLKGNYQVFGGNPLSIFPEHDPLHSNYCRGTEALKDLLFAGAQKVVFGDDSVNGVERVVRNKATHPEASTQSVADIDLDAGEGTSGQASAAAVLEPPIPAVNTGDVSELMHALTAMFATFSRQMGLAPGVGGGDAEYRGSPRDTLKDEVLNIMPVQKQTRASQRTRFKAFVAIGDFNGQWAWCTKCSKEVATAILEAIILAKLVVIPVAGAIGETRSESAPPCPASIVSAPVPKKLLHMAGIEDYYTLARGSTATLGNFAKTTYLANQQAYSYLTPDLWREWELIKFPYQKFTDYLRHVHRHQRRRDGRPGVQ
ncbi:hypothetical protein HPB47_013237 [Ixodes persulcatus]|uniref:Uncharacterized protein n=1 Tax=Ixodes persulcatus TaxID=34615 RepID=A0AC60QYZ8_IXOPE|nr:hypothetical protein HPB47_013237 [Ixodes persulcatus]